MNKKKFKQFANFVASFIVFFPLILTSFFDQIHFVQVMLWNVGRAIPMERTQSSVKTRSIRRWLVIIKGKTAMLNVVHRQAKWIHTVMHPSKVPFAWNSFKLVSIFPRLDAWQLLISLMLYQRNYWGRCDAFDFW